MFSVYDPYLSESVSTTPNVTVELCYENQVYWVNFKELKAKKVKN